MRGEELRDEGREDLNENDDRPGVGNDEVTGGEYYAGEDDIGEAYDGVVRTTMLLDAWRDATGLDCRVRD